MPTTPAASIKAVGRDQATNAHTIWKTAIDAKKTPDGSQSFQCIGATAKWMTAAPKEAIAAHRAPRRLSVLDATRDATNRH